MNRREAIQRASLVLGYTLTGPALVGVLQGCKASPELTYKPIFFSEDQALLISELSEIIIPKTNTPGAKDVGVPGFIDQMLKDIYTKGNSFATCTVEERNAFVKKQHDAAFSKGVDLGSTAWWNAGGGGETPFIVKVKELTIIGFFTSEPGATQVLQYNQVPGPFKGCVPLAEVGKAWAT
jgi:gluconate 2-dehydrogenase gamma chain